MNIIEKVMLSIGEALEFEPGPVPIFVYGNTINTNNSAIFITYTTATILDAITTKQKIERRMNLRAELTSIVVVVLHEDTLNLYHN